MVFVYPDQRGEALFPLLTGICCREGQGSEFKDQKVMHLHHLVDFNSKYQQQLQSTTFTAEHRLFIAGANLICIIYLTGNEYHAF